MKIDSTKAKELDFDKHRIMTHDSNNLINCTWEF